jgi:hypothetical protein
MLAKKTGKKAYRPQFALTRTREYKACHDELNLGIRVRRRHGCMDAAKEGEMEQREQ